MKLLTHYIWILLTLYFLQCSNNTKNMMQNILPAKKFRLNEIKQWSKHFQNTRQKHSRCNSDRRIKIAWDHKRNCGKRRLICSFSTRGDIFFNGKTRDVCVHTLFRFRFLSRNAMRCKSRLKYAAAKLNVNRCNLSSR